MKLYPCYKVGEGKRVAMLNRLGRGGGALHTSFEVVLRIDNSWQGMILATLLSSAAILCTVSY